MSSAESLYNWTGYRASFLSFIATETLSAKCSGPVSSGQSNSTTFRATAHVGLDPTPEGNGRCRPLP